MAVGLKKGVKWALARLGITSAVARLIEPSTAILAYHNIVPEGEVACGSADLHTDQAVFARHLEFLLDSYEIVPLETVLTLEPGPRPRLAITFDDAYRGTMSAGLEELARRGLPSTVFVPPGLLGTRGFWWDLIGERDGRLNADFREMCLVQMKGRAATVLEWAHRMNMSLPALPQHAWACEESDLSAVVQRGASIGNHTWSHANLAALEPSAARAEVKRARNWLVENVDGYIDYLAYPYGRVNEHALDNLGSRATALTVGRGLVAARGAQPPSRLRIPRINVPRGMTLEGLAFRLLGLEERIPARLRKRSAE